MTARSLILFGLLASLYALLLVPLGLVLRLVRIDPLERRWRSNATSYWVLHDGKSAGRAFFRRQM
jgi:hypothetical protein